MNIALRVKNLACRHNTRDPFRIAKELGIHIKFLPYEQTKGYFCEVHTNKFIVINSNLDEFSQLIVAAHELGHALLHSNNKCGRPTQPIQDYTLFPTDSIYENEANKFAAELLIHEDMNYDEICFENTGLSKSTYETLLRLKHTKI